jgi:hypothetical protein
MNSNLSTAKYTCNLHVSNNQTAVQEVLPQYFHSRFNVGAGNILLYGQPAQNLLP